MVHLGEDVLFVLDMINMLALNDLVFFHRFYGVLIGRVATKPSNLDETEGT